MYLFYKYLLTSVLVTGEGKMIDRPAMAACWLSRMKTGNGSHGILNLACYIYLLLLRKISPSFAFSFFCPVFLWTTLPVRLTGELQCWPHVTSHSVAVAMRTSVMGAQLLLQIKFADTHTEREIYEKREPGNVEKISWDA